MSMDSMFKIFSCIKVFSRAVQPACWCSASIYIEAFIKSNLFNHLTATERREIRVSGILLPNLLFSDDTVFIKIDMQVV